MISLSGGSTGLLGGLGSILGGGLGKTPTKGDVLENALQTSSPLQKGAPAQKGAPTQKGEAVQKGDIAQNGAPTKKASGFNIGGLFSGLLGCIMGGVSGFINGGGIQAVMGAVTGAVSGGGNPAMMITGGLTGFMGGGGLQAIMGGLSGLLGGLGGITGGSSSSGAVAQKNAGQDISAEKMAAYEPQATADILSQQQGFPSGGSGAMMLPPDPNLAA